MVFTNRSSLEWKHTTPFCSRLMERREAVIQHNRFDSPALACFVAVPFEGTLELELSIIAAPNTHLDFHVVVVIPKSFSTSMLQPQDRRLGGMRLARYRLAGSLAKRCPQSRARQPYKSPASSINCSTFSAY
jgi:hypothetical protein